MPCRFSPRLLGEACAVTDSLAQDFPVERRSLPGLLRGQMKLRRCWVIAWHRGKPTLGDLPLDVEVDFIKTKAPVKRNLREESVVVRALVLSAFRYRRSLEKGAASAWCSAP